MLITKTSMISGITRTVDVPVTEQQMEAWRAGLLIQDAMPGLSDAQREFVMTGITHDEWQAFCQEFDELDEGP